MRLPKVIDFGIAKATQGRLTDQTLFTAYEQFMGTPTYMSPEQAQLSSAEVDTRSDIYSLGVLLYELLTGQTPFAQKELLAHGLECLAGMPALLRPNDSPCSNLCPSVSSCGFISRAGSMSSTSLPASPFLRLASLQVIEDCCVRWNGPFVLSLQTLKQR